jgi:uncharacterized membrane protein (UPF0127 family)
MGARVRRCLPAVLVCALACSHGAGVAPARTGGAAATPQVTVHIGGVAALRVEVAASPAERGRGLMHRARVAPGTGMLFVFPDVTTSRFYMLNTLVPLSIAFVRGGRVVSVAEMAPCRAEPCRLYPAAGPYTLAVEAPEGTFEHVRPGDPVRVDGPLPTSS